MFLKEVHLLNFKNYEDKSLLFSPKINCFVGNNGVGKTNILDAIYYLSFCKSFSNPIDKNNIRHKEIFFMIEGKYQSELGDDKILCSVKRGSKKIIKRNDKEYEKLSHHIGKIPLVMISPYDRNLIIEGGEHRRKFMDAVISQTDKSYLNCLMGYNKTIVQRNALLKYFVQNSTFDKDQVDIYNSILTRTGTEIFEKRRQFIQELNPLISKYYASISSGAETIEMAYESKLAQLSLDILLDQALDKDMRLQHTSVGIHRDDLLFNMDGHAIKRFGSQGQQKTFLIALRLAQFELLKRITEKKPILLLDDIFDKLDEQRVEELIKLVNLDHFGQIFITDTHTERIESLVEKLKPEHLIFELK